MFWQPSKAIPALALVIAVLPLLAALLARRLGKGVETRDAAAGGIVATTALAVCAYLAVGSAGILTGRRFPLTLVVAVALALVAALLLFTGRREPPVPRSAGRSRPKLDPFLVLSAAAAAGLYAAVVVRSLRLGVFGWDSTFYHLPVALRWSQTGSLGDPYGVAGVVLDNPNFGDSVAFYPGNGNLFHLVAIEAFGHVGARFGQLPFVVLGAFLVHVIARSAGARSRPAALAAIVFATMPVVVFQSATSYTDVITADWLLAGVAMTLGWWRYRSPPWALLAGLSFGLALGSKLAAITSVALVGGLAGMIGLLRNRRLKPVLAGGLLLAGLALPSTFWYARNWAMLGSPVFPVKVAAGDRVIFDGADFRSDKQFQFIGEAPPDRLLRRWLGQPFTEYASEEVGAGLPVVALGVPGFALALWAAAGRDRRPVLLAAFLGAALLAWWATNHEPRHTIAGLGMAAACSALVPHAWPRRARVVLLLGAVLLVGINAGWVWSQYDRNRPVTPERSTPPCGVFVQEVLDAVDHVPDGALILNDVTLPGDGSVSTCNYALAGPRYEHGVIWEPWNILPAEAGEARSFMDRFGIGYVFVRKAPQDEMPARYAPPHFELFFSGQAYGNEVYLFRVGQA